MPRLELFMLGTLDIRYDGQPVPKPPTLNSQSLLAYLVLHRDRPQPRERLAGLFWGDRPERKARRSLTTALWHIQRCLSEKRYLLTDPHTVQFDAHADLWLDVDVFKSRAAGDGIAHLESAAALYGGDFLDGFYDDWIINERYRLETQFSGVLTRLMVGHETAGEQEAALSTAQRLLELDPLREDAHRLAMRALCRLGQRNTALEQYRRCQETVRQELGAEPMVETTELYHAILDGRLEIRPAATAPPGTAAESQPPLPRGTHPLAGLLAAERRPRFPEAPAPLELFDGNRIVRRRRRGHVDQQPDAPGRQGVQLPGGQGAGNGIPPRVLPGCRGWARRPGPDRGRGRGGQDPARGRIRRPTALARELRHVGSLLRVRTHAALPARRRSASNGCAHHDAFRIGAPPRLDPGRGGPAGPGDPGEAARA